MLICSTISDRCQFRFQSCFILSLTAENIVFFYKHDSKATRKEKKNKRQKYLSVVKHPPNLASIAAMHCSQWEAFLQVSLLSKVNNNLKLLQLCKLFTAVFDKICS